MTGRQSDVRDLARQLDLADATIRELWGSYQSLVGVTGREDALNWDGPHMVRSYWDQYGPPPVGASDESTPRGRGAAPLF